MPGENIIRGDRRLLRLQEPSDHHVRIDSYSRPNNLWGKDEWRGAENLGTTEEDKNVDDVLSGLLYKSVKKLPPTWQELFYDL